MSLILESLNPENDGIDHINCYSKARTELGRLLTNFADSPFEHPKYGKFRSVECLWVWLKTGRIYDRLKNLPAREVKKEGNRLFPNHLKDSSIELPEEFKQIIREGIQCKLRQNREILWALISTDLPLKHYYVVRGRMKPQNQHNWVLEEIDRIRNVTRKWYIEKYGELPNISLTFID